MNQSADTLGTSALGAESTRRYPISTEAWPGGAVCAFCANAIDREWALGNHIKELADNQKEHRAARGRRPRNSHVGERGNRD